MSESSSPRGLQVDFVKGVVLCLGGGAVAGFVTVLVPWALGWNELLQALGIQTGSANPVLSGLRYVGIRALWGLAFYPFLDGVRLNPTLSGVFVSLFFSLYQLLIGFPIVKQDGLLGLSHGWLGPVGVPLWNLLWGWGVAFLIRWLLIQTQEMEAG